VMPLFSPFRTFSMTSLQTICWSVQNSLRVTITSAGAICSTDTINPQCGHDRRTIVSSITIIRLVSSALRTRRHANSGYGVHRIKEKIWVSTLPARKIRAVIPKINVSIVSIYNIILCLFTSVRIWSMRRAHLPKKRSSRCSKSH
jgi:hypothetical protein